MEFRFTPEEDSFRADVREFIHTETPEQLRNSGGGESSFSTQNWPHTLEFRKKLGARGWIGISWPKEYGGLGESLVKQAILKEELSYWRAPMLDAQAYQLGPSLIVHGTEEQKKRYLPGIASAEDVWCQGFSEPNAGSDLASLQTRAEIDGDEFVINGQKIWTSGAHLAEYIHLLARTDPEAPKHRGISYFLFSMKTPGVTVKPIRQANDGEGFNEVYFDNVRISKDSIFGELNRGWYVATTTLDFERSNVAGAAGAQRNLDDLVAYCTETTRLGERLIDRPDVRYRLAEAAVEIQVARMLSYRVLSLQANGQVPNMEASLAKLFSVDVSGRLAIRAMEILGLTGQLHGGGRHAPMNGHRLSHYLSTMCSVGGGSQEIQRNIIATRGLGLPR